MDDKDHLPSSGSSVLTNEVLTSSDFKKGRQGRIENSEFVPKSFVGVCYAITPSFETDSDVSFMLERKLMKIFHL